MSKEQNKDVGDLGEEIAREYLEKKGYKILDQNYKNKIGELDIVAKDGSVFVFVEVKTKTSERFGKPEEMVNFWKQKKLLAVSKFYVLENKLEGKEVRIDVVTVNFDDPDEVRVEHFENAVEDN